MPRRRLPSLIFLACASVQLAIGQEDQPAPAAEQNPAEVAEPAVEDALAPAPDAGPVAPANLVQALGHDTYKTRVEAQQSLLEWGEKDLKVGVPAIYKVFRSAEDPEIRLRSRDVLKALVIVLQPLDGDGYLGIQMEPARWKNERGILQPAVLVTDVREGTAGHVFDQAQLVAVGGAAWRVLHGRLHVDRDGSW